LELRRGIAWRERDPESCLEKGSRGATKQLLDVLIIQMRRDLVQLDGLPEIQRTGNCRAGLSRAAFFKTYTVDSRGRGNILGYGVLEAIKNFIGGVLETGVGLVQLAGRLGSELAEFVAVGDVGESSKNEI
jgi:hypothetical protein